MLERQEQETACRLFLYDFFFIGLQEMRFRNSPERSYHDSRIQMMSIVQYQSELDSGSAHEVTLFIIMIPTLRKLLYTIYPRMEEIIFISNDQW